MAYGEYYLLELNSELIEEHTSARNLHCSLFPARVIVVLQGDRPKSPQYIQCHNTDEVRVAFPWNTKGIGTFRLNYETSGSIQQH